MTDDEVDPPSALAAARIARPTMRDVAAKAGVSQQLVSMVIRNVPGPSEASRERVIAAARQIGYTPDAAASVLRRRRSRHLGVLFNLKQPFEAEIVEALYPAARERGYDLVLGAITPDRDATHVLDELRAQRSEAILVTTSTSDPSQLVNVARRVPVIEIGRAESRPNMDAVGVENRTGARAAIDHLVALGHRQICHIDGGDRKGALERKAGYLEGMRAHGLVENIEVIAGDYSDESGASAGRQLLRSGLPTAVFAGNDNCANGLVFVLQQAGVRVPEDVSVVGFDDIQAASLLGLTTVRQDAASLARLAVHTALERLDEGRAESVDVRIEPELTVRASTAPPRAV